MAISARIRNGVGMVSDVPPVKTPADGQLTANQIRYILDSLQALISAVNGGITFGNGQNSTQSGNIDGHTKEVTFASANTDYEVPHGLGRVPIGIVLLDTNVDGAVVRGASQGSWNTTRLFVRCNQAGTTALFVVV